MKANEDEKTIREMLETFSDAVRAGDAKRAVSMNAAKITSYEIRPPLEYRDAAASSAKDMQEWFETFEGPLEIDVREPTIMIDGDLAFAWGLTHLRGKKKETGPVDLWYRLTLCFQRQQGKWKVVHEHQ